MKIKHINKLIIFISIILTFLFIGPIWGLWIIIYLNLDYIYSLPTVIIPIAYTIIWIFFIKISANLTYMKERNNYGI